MYAAEAGPKADKEKVSSDKLASLRSLIFGLRAKQFDAFLPYAPNSEELTEVARYLHKPEIRHVIFDVDGTLVPPYAPISESVLAKLQGYREQGRSVAVYSNSADIDRFRILRSNGIHVAATCIGKPTLRGFEVLCEKQKMDPAHTAMMGNFPVTDMPLVEEGQPPFFPLNILTDSIPPRRELVESWSKYFRARVFHMLNVTTARIVLYRNPNLLRAVPISCTEETRS